MPARNRQAILRALISLGCLLLGFSFACRASAPVTPDSGPTLLATVAAGDEQIFTTWSPLPGAHRHLVRWRASGASRWQVAEVKSRTQHVITALSNHVMYEVQVETYRGTDRAGRSGVLRTSPRDRDSCSALNFIPGARPVSFFCAPAALERYLHATGIDPLELRCRQQPARITSDAPDCLYSAAGEQLLLLRAADDVFHAPADYPSRVLIRDAARRAIWSAGSPFDTSATGTWVPARPTRIGQVTGHLTARSYDLIAVHGLGSRITWFDPPDPVDGRFAIYHEGHGGAAIDIGADTIDWLLARGWTVIAADMPLIGLNAPDAGPGLTSHMDLASLDDGVTSPLSRFLAPVKAMVDLVTARQGSSPPTILLIGRSGGGWTAYTYGALDPRIALTVSIAGGRPVSSRLDATWGGSDLGDYEQTAPHLYNVVGHEYLMLAAGSAGALYVFNQSDTCCFRVEPDDPFVRYLKGTPDEERIVDVFVDTENRAHTLGPLGYVALERFLTRVLRAGRPTP